MADWETPDSTTADEAALVEQTVNIRLVNPAQPRDAAALQEAANKGWTAPTATTALRETVKKDVYEANDEMVNMVASDPVYPWAGSAVKYTWDGDVGDLGPVNLELEKELFGGELRTRKGIVFDDLFKIKVTAEGTEKPLHVLDWKDAGLHTAMLNNIQLCGYDRMTPIQCYAVPAIVQGYDVIGVAQTGSGKTLAYLAPALSKLMGKAKKMRGPRGDRVRGEPLLLVVVPTRELAIQIFDEARRLCYRSMLRPCVAYGGGPVREQRADLQRGCDVLICTPGRLIDFLQDTSVLSLLRVRFTIIDEADEMLHEDWSDDLAKIMSGGGATDDDGHQYLLFSATFPAALRKLAKKYLKQDYVRIRMGRIGSTLPNIKQQIIWVDNNRKQEALYDLIIAGKACRTLIFVKSKRMVDVVDDFLYHKGMPVTSIHADRDQLSREDAIRAFRSGKCPIMVATGVSSRGLDVSNILHVINYDLPSIDYGGPDEYIHRMGRTGRLGNPGLCSSFYNDNDEPMAPFLAKLLAENSQICPDFLEQYKPTEGEPLDFEDDSEDEDETPGGEVAAVGGGEAWGGDTVAAVKEESNTGDAWGNGNGNTDTSGDGW